MTDWGIFWSRRTLFALALFDLLLVCAAGVVGEQRTAGRSRNESGPRLSRSDDCQDKLIDSLRHAEFLGVGQRSRTWDRPGPQLHDADWVDPMSAGWATSGGGLTSLGQVQQLSKQILLCVWLI